MGPKDSTLDFEIDEDNTFDFGTGEESTLDFEIDEDNTFDFGTGEESTLDFEIVETNNQDLNQQDLDKATKLKEIKTEEEGPENEIGVIASVLAGVGSGLISIPKGLFSLGATLTDLGADTDNAAKVEKWFDDLTVLDEMAEATTAGKITELLVNIGVPGAFAFTKGAQLAQKALQSKKLGQYFVASGDLAKVGKKVKKSNELLKLNKKGMALKTVSTLGASGAAEAVFVGDVEDAGTFGDFMGGPTEIDRSDDNDPAKELLNRIKFGTEGALFTGVLGGTGKLIGQIVKRNKGRVQSNNKIDKVLDYLHSKISTIGPLGRDGFIAKRLNLGLAREDLVKAQNISRDMDKQIDRVFPAYKKVFSKLGDGKILNKTEFKEKLNKLLLKAKPSFKQIDEFAPDPKTGKPIPIGKKESIDFGKLDTKLKKEIQKMFKEPKTGKYIIGSEKMLDDVFESMDGIREQWGEMFGALGQGIKNVSKDSFNEFKKEFGNKMSNYLDSTYKIFENKSLLGFNTYKPTDDLIHGKGGILSVFKNAAKTKGVKVTDQQLLDDIDDIIESARMPKSLAMKEGADPSAVVKLPSYFFGKGDSLLSSFGKATKSKENFISIAGLTGKTKEAMDNILGKISDPTQTILSGSERLSSILRKTQFYDDLLKASDAAKASGRPGLFYTSENEARKALGRNVEKLRFDDVKNSGDVFDPSVKNNPLHDKWTTLDIARSFNKSKKIAADEFNLPGTIYNTFVLYPKSLSQVAKTILSPVTHMRNFISAGAFLAANQGPLFFMKPSFIKNFRNAYQALDVAMIGTRKQKELYNELLRLGVVNNNVRLGDLRALMSDVKFGEKLSATNGFNLIAKKVGKFKKWTEDMYTAEDDIWKITGWAMEQARLKRAFGNKGLKFGDEFTDINGVKQIYSEQFLKEEAADLVRNTIPNYDYVSEFVKDLRGLPFGNFVSFPAEIIRTGINIVERAVKEITHPGFMVNNKLVKPYRGAGFQRLIGFGTTVAVVPYMTVEAMKTLHNVSQDQLDALKRFVPKWSKNSTILPIRDEKTGELKYVDFSHGNAYDTLIRPIQAVINQVSAGETDENGIMDDFVRGVAVATSELASPFVSESIWTKALVDVTLRRGKDANGRNIWNPNDKTGNKVRDALKHLGKTQLPGSISAFKRLDYAIEDKDLKIPFTNKTLLQKEEGIYDERGRTFEIQDELLGFAGFRAIKVDPLIGMNFKIYEFTKASSGSDKLFTSTLLKGGPVSSGDIMDRLILANQQGYLAQNELMKDYYAALELETSSKELDDLFKKRGLKKDLEQIKKGFYKPYIPSDNIEEKFEEMSRELGVVDPYKSSKGFINFYEKLFERVPLGLPKFPEFENPYKEVELPSNDTSYFQQNSTDPKDIVDTAGSTIPIENQNKLGTTNNATINSFGDIVKNTTV